MYTRVCLPLSPEPNYWPPSRRTGMHEVRKNSYSLPDPLEDIIQRLERLSEFGFNTHCKKPAYDEASDLINFNTHRKGEAFEILNTPPKRKLKKINNICNELRKPPPISPKHEYNRSKSKLCVQKDAHKTYKSPIKNRAPPPIGYDQLKDYFEGLEKIKKTLKTHDKRSEIPKCKVSYSSKLKNINFPPITEKQKLHIAKVLKGDKEKIVINKLRVNITTEDLNTIRGQNWLNDKIINFYFALIQERSTKVANYPYVYCMDLFLLKVYEKNGYADVKAWTLNVDLFSYDIVFIPIHSSYHWTLIKIDFRQQTITSCDSFPKSNKDALLRTVTKYLEEESLHKRKIPFPVHEYRISNARDYPTQTNSFDCGIFCCMGAEYFSRGVEVCTFEETDMPYFREKMILEVSQGTLMSI